MSTFKITNITNYLGKRDAKYNTSLGIEYVDDMIKKTIDIKEGETIYLTMPSLPISVHLLRVKNFITVTEVGGDEIANIKIKSIIKPIIETAPVIEEQQPKSIKKTIPKEEVIN